MQTVRARLRVKTICMLSSITSDSASRNMRPSGSHIPGPAVDNNRANQILQTELSLKTFNSFELRFPHSLAPSLLSLMELVGFDQGQVKHTQKIAAAAHANLAFGRSLAAHLLLYDDPTSRPACAILLWWQKELRFW